MKLFYYILLMSCIIPTALLYAPPPKKQTIAEKKAAQRAALKRRKEALKKVKESRKKPAQPKRIPTKKIKTKSKGAFFELVPLTHDNFPTVGSLILYKGIKLVLLEDAESQAQKNEFQKQIDQINAAIKRYNKQQPPKKFWGRGKRAETIYDRIAEELENWVNPPLFEEE